MSIIKEIFLNILKQNTSQFRTNGKLLYNLFFYMSIYQEISYLLEKLISMIQKAYCKCH